MRHIYFDNGLMRAEIGGVKKYSPPRDTMKSVHSPLVSLGEFIAIVSPLTFLHCDGPVPVGKVEPFDVSGSVLGLSVSLEVAYNGIRALYERC